jgi:hypothetical protein
MGAMLQVSGRPEGRRPSIITPIEQSVEGLEDERPVLYLVCCSHRCSVTAVNPVNEEYLVAESVCMLQGEVGKRGWLPAGNLREVVEDLVGPDVYAVR